MQQRGGQKIYQKKQSWNLAFWQLGNKVAKIKDLEKTINLLCWENPRKPRSFQMILGKGFWCWDANHVFTYLGHAWIFWGGDSADFLPDFFCLGRKWYHPFTSWPITSNSHSASMTWWCELCDTIHLTWTWPQSGVTSLLKVVAHSPPIGKNMH